MRTALQRLGRDLRRRRNIDAYAVTAVTVVFAIINLVSDIVPDRLIWAALLAGIGLLVFRITVPDANGPLDALLGDRSGFDDNPLGTRLRDIRELWLFAPSGVNFLSMPNLDVLRTRVLARSDGCVRVVVLDPSNQAAVSLAERQLDSSLDFPLQHFQEALATVTGNLAQMADWDVAGNFDYRLLDHNPGFSLVGLDPSSNSGVLIVEFHGFHNESTSTRLHVELRRADSARWYQYWLEQFEHIWAAAKVPPSAPSSLDPNRPNP